MHHHGFLQAVITAVDLTRLLRAGRLHVGMGRYDGIGTPPNRTDIRGRRLMEATASIDTIVQWRRKVGLTKKDVNPQAARRYGEQQFHQ
jgi:hypothetical protein